MILRQFLCLVGFGVMALLLYSVTFFGVGLQMGGYFSNPVLFGFIISFIAYSTAIISTILFVYFERKFVEKTEVA